jgi:hypothetical protein
MIMDEGKAWKSDITSDGVFVLGGNASNVREYCQSLQTSIGEMG